MQLSFSWKESLGGIPISTSLPHLVGLLLLMGWGSLIGLSSMLAPRPMPSTSTQLLIAGAGSVILILSLLLHELAHGWVAQRNNQEVEKVTLHWWGGTCSYKRNFRLQSASLFEGFAGPAVQFLLAGLLGGAAWMTTGLTSTFFQSQALLQLIVGGGNLLPLFPLDGGRITSLLLAKWSDQFSQGVAWTYRSGPLIVFVIGMPLWLKYMPSRAYWDTAAFWSWLGMGMLGMVVVLYSWWVGRQQWKFYTMLEDWNEYSVRDLVQFDLESAETDQPIQSLLPLQSFRWGERQGQRVGLLAPCDIPPEGTGPVRKYMWSIDHLPTQSPPLDTAAGDVYLEAWENREESSSSPVLILDEHQGVGVLDLDTALQQY